MELDDTASRSSRRQLNRVRLGRGGGADQEVPLRSGREHPPCTHG